ncbi:MAG: hypothetical protein HW382_1137 [Deltaproteobacteria bacterium]|nr:hypothetical protein [Deltaproteobacteria bacterium]MBM2838436.1 hypothetical protein [Deltaproteobacteria bacterium]
MKKVVFAALVVAMGMGIGSGNAFAEGNKLGYGSKSLGITVHDEIMIKYKLGLDKDLALLLGFGLRNSNENTPAGSKGTELQLEAGIRKYLKIADLAPFAEGGLQVISNSGGTTDRTGFQIFAGAGAEYFLNKQFSIEGSAGVGLSLDSYKTAGTTTSSTTLSTQRLGMGLNFYF